MDRKRFFFDVNNFDSPDSIEEKPEIEEVHVPVYYDADIEKARATGFKSGKAEGFRESEEGLTRDIKDLLGQMNVSLRKLLDNEKERSDAFEKETVSVSLAALDVAFPLLREKLGIEEVSSILENAIKISRSSNKIKIEVGKEYQDTIDSYVSSAFEGVDGKVTVTGNEKMGGGDVSVAWDHGKALRSQLSLEEELLNLLKQELAQEDISPQDSNEHKDGETKK